jgi:hypothetical protein
MKEIIITILMGVVFTGGAQVVERDVISSTGDFYSNGSGQLSVTIGEIITTTISDGINELTQGFHQAIITVTNIENHSIDFEMNVFPNPTSKSVTIIVKELKDNISLTLYGVDGKIILTERIRSLETKLNVEQFANGVYFLNLIKDGQLIKSYKVLKQ